MQHEVLAGNMEQFDVRIKQLDMYYGGKTPQNAYD